MDVVGCRPLGTADSRLKNSRLLPLNTNKVNEREILVKRVKWYMVVVVVYLFVVCLIGSNSAF